MNRYISLLQKQAAYIKKQQALVDKSLIVLKKQSDSYKSLLYSKLDAQFPQFYAAGWNHISFVPRQLMWADLINKIPMINHLELLRVYDLSSLPDAKEITFELGSNVHRVCGHDKTNKFLKHEKFNFSQNLKIKVPLDDDFESNLMGVLLRINDLFKSLE